MSRRWRQRKAVSEVALFIADELHLLGAADGPTLEVVLSRMRSISKLLSKPLRMVGLASSIANARDVGEWLGAPAHAAFSFAPGVRPVPLEIHIQSLDIANFEARVQVRAVTCPVNWPMRDRTLLASARLRCWSLTTVHPLTLPALQAMSRPTYAAICAHAGDTKPVIVFAPTRKAAKQVTADLLTYAAADRAPLRFLKARAPRALCERAPCRARGKCCVRVGSLSADEHVRR